MNIILKTKYCQYLYYIFSPQEDITAYELAISLMAIEHCKAQGSFLYTETDLGWNLIKRHFVNYA